MAKTEVSMPLPVITSHETVTDLSAATETAPKRLALTKATAFSASNGRSGWKLLENCNDWQAAWVTSLQS
jgi:hypothetical protein